MTQQRISSLLFPILLAASGCGGGPGTPVDIDPDAPPKVADQQPTLTNQNPVSPGSVPPITGQAPNTPPVTSPPGGGGGDSCVARCNALPARGCQTPEDGCEASCADLLGSECGAQLYALQVCALQVACPEELMDHAQEIVATCPSQYQAYLACTSVDE